MADDKTNAMLKSLEWRWRSAQRMRSMANGAAGFLVLTSILSSFLASIIATKVFPSLPSSTGAVVVVSALPGLCLTIWRQFPFRQWALFQNIRYVEYREIHTDLQNETIDLATAVQRLNAVARKLATAAEAVPFVGFQDASHSG
jgi:hypothetical protein